MRSEYEPYTAVTFLLVGLGVGTVLALFMAPHPARGLIKRGRVSV